MKRRNKHQIGLGSMPNKKICPKGQTSNTVQATYSINPLTVKVNVK